MIRLTPKQAEALQHRLDVPDCLFEALEGLEALHETQESFDACVEALSAEVKKRRLDPDALTDLEKAILIECVEGSVLAGLAISAHESGAMPWCAVGSTFKMLRSLADKLYPLKGSEIVAPCW